MRLHGSTSVRWPVVASRWHRLTVAGRTEWMPLPRAISGFRRAFGKHWQAGVQVIAGGWGRVRPAAWARWRMPNERAFMIYIEDPWGWGSDSAYGRGVTLRYESL